MTRDAALSYDEEADLAAAEYVLGGQDAAARAAAELRLRADPAFVAAVAAWEQRLATLNDGFAARAAPNLLPAIEARLFARQPKPAWRWIPWLAGALVAASLAGAVFFTTTAGPDLVTQIAGTASDLRFAASIDGDTLTLTRLSGAPPAPGTAHELWLIIGDASPLSLGLIGDAGFSLALPQAAAGAVLAITLEPAGGGPEGKPTGPILASGVLAQG